MVPLHLRLYNFLSYQGETELDLRGIHVGCLSGDNGNGKSALLDAVTWALWGWARGRRYGAGGTSPDELVYQGQTDMEVALTFAAGEAVYRMVRKHSRGGARRSAARMVDLQAGTGDGFRSLTEGSVRDTEVEVERLLRMSYETFVNSAFLLQGEADRFSTSRPAQRKEILADVLGLSLYERLQERARERVREFDADLLRNRMAQDSADADLAMRPATEEALSEAERALADVAPRLQTARAEEGALELQVAELDRAQEQAERLRASRTQRLDEAERLGVQAEQSRERASRFSDVLSRGAEIVDGAARLKEVQALLESLDETQRQDAALERKALGLQHTIAQAEGQLRAEADRLRDRIDRDLQPRVERGKEARASLAGLAAEEEGITRQRGVVQERRDALNAAVRTIERLETDNRRLHTEIEEMRGGYRMLREGETHCPLCGTALGEDGIAHLLQERERQGRERRAQYDANAAELASLGPRRKRLESEVVRADAVLEQAQRNHTASVAALDREVAEGEQAESLLGSLSTELDALLRRLESDDFAQDEQAALAEALLEREVLTYDGDEHEQARDSLRELQPYENLARDLRDAEERLPQEQAALAEFEQLALARRNEAADLEQQLAEIGGRLESAPALREQLGGKAQERRRLESRASELQAEVQVHKLRLEALQAREKELKGLLQERDDLLAAKSSFGVLVEAFGRAGIQALLIEAALPELEGQANDLLARLTDHRMTLSLETQRQSRQGNVSETLEIRIADELGTRSYELFSGGEAFRIDFALRVALARLLASRAGAPLRTLFLDEGFGTQDPGGRERLVSAIQTIQDEFDLILVVTHIEEMKEAFPVRIDVTKDDTGSSLEVVWA